MGVNLLAYEVLFGLHQSSPTEKLLPLQTGSHPRDFLLVYSTIGDPELSLPEVSFLHFRSARGAGLILKDKLVSYLGNVRSVTVQSLSVPGTGARHYLIGGDSVDHTNYIVLGLDRNRHWLAELWRSGSYRSYVQLAHVKGRAVIREV